MAKVSKTKSKKKKLMLSCGVPDSSERLQQLPRENEEEEEEEEKGGMDAAEEETMSSEEDEGLDERKRQKLLEAIRSLGGKRKKALGERSEAAGQMSEFSVNPDGGPDKVQLSDLIGSLEKIPAVPAKSRKQLKNLQRSKKTIESPLSKQETERIQRDMAFQKAASEVSRWDAVIIQNQRAEQLVFPLDRDPAGPKPVERLVMGWSAQTPLEQEIFALLSANKQPLTDPILTPAEEASVKAMSLEEAKIRRAELQKARALQSYYEAKARRERKIKSKKYHKVQNKAKRKEFQKHFEEMVKTDPAVALQELNKMELARMQERMSLKHQNSSKWAKSKAIMAKYDQEARKAMQQQLEMNKELTQKLIAPLNHNDDDDDDEEEGLAANEADLLPDFVNDAVDGRDASNPWMKGKLSAEPAQQQPSDLLREAAQAACEEEEEDEEEEEQAGETEDEALLREFNSRRKLHRAQESDAAGSVFPEDRAAALDSEVSDSDDVCLLETPSISTGRENVLKETKATDCSERSAPLEERLMRIRTVEDLEFLPDEPSDGPSQPPSTKAPPSEEKHTGKRRKRGIELKEVLTKETKVIKVPFTPTVTDSEDPEAKMDQRGLIKEAFAGDDVISDFLKDKRRKEDEGKSKVIDLTLPGWGDWGGVGLKPPKRKRRRFRVQSAPPPPRKDQQLPSVIISEKRNASVSLHQVHSLPFPFEDQAQFENCIRSPLGRAWNTERTVKKVTKPSVVTQLGAIIHPMAEEELLKNKKKVAATGSG
ncbi:U3 small nucleolar RNA-associated protein 14 homolog A-like [Poeciliopsis prolifica]|uniref:U3 small nucleolar RNA-associated protein 14 homolog A-like n=1 Tax=Poeciliopsis prolifica TaxID=188132 RepID=UPI00241413F2|nr:U3 small nucleolar RNA-associated protein 14 homolog A-like [Poeciliopsis prolifica]